MISRHLIRGAAVALFIHCTVVVAAGDLVHHRFKIRLLPDRNRITVSDEITVPGDLMAESDGSIVFSIHGGMEPVSGDPGITLTLERVEQDDVGTERWRVSVPPGKNVIDLRYEGRIHHPLRDVGKEYARGQKETAGSISPEGIFLSGNSRWYPDIAGELLSFDMEVTLPAGWDAISQGERTLHADAGDESRVTWSTCEPQDEIFLVGGEYIEYMGDSDGVQRMVFLRDPDRKLAEQYLEAAEDYLGMYAKLIGPYPYRKFALVENFWETGYGMPSFTLLGPLVIRFPFILHSSYPHEILHNYWGNSVYIDYRSGNWGEGLTAYLSDHLIKEQRNDGTEYRQTTLQKYADYVLKERDMPLSEFTSRHGSVTEAVGYGKSMMLFHMLRLRLGDDVFTACLKEFYRRYRWKVANFDALMRIFEEVSKAKLEEFFRHWVDRPGAPQIGIREVVADTDEEGYDLRVILEQVQSEDAFPAQVPVAVTMEGLPDAVLVTVPITGKTGELVMSVSERPLRIDVDPEFDVFRRLHRNEIPPALSQAFGSEKALIILPSFAEEESRAAYKSLAEFLKKSGPGVVEALEDREMKKIPADASIWILGWENRHLPWIKDALQEAGASLTEKGVRIERYEIQREDHAVVACVRHPGNPDLAVMWIAIDVPDSAQGLGRKLPHYHKYSYLVFEGREPENIAKGRWPVTGSPLTAVLAPGGSPPPMGRLPERKALAELPPSFSAKRMTNVVERLAALDMKGRGFGTEELERAASYIAGKFAEAGLAPGGESRGSYFQMWTELGGDPPRKAVMKNVIGIIPGTGDQVSGESVVIGAHYDHLGLGLPGSTAENRGVIHPGADDNASGVAVLLELAEVFSGKLKPDRSVIFVAFTGEESGKLGSRHFIENMGNDAVERVIGMINLDTVGRLEKKKLMILGSSSAREWVHILRGAEYLTGIETETAGGDLDSGDHMSFQAAGIPAIQLFTGPHLDYHRPTDTADKIDSRGLVMVASVAREVIEYLADGKASLTATHLSRETRGDSAGVGARKVSLGTVPDFSYSGGGVRISGVVPGSAAEKRGLRKGDIIISVNDSVIRNLKDLSYILKTLTPGEIVNVTFRRDDRAETVLITVESR